MILRIDCCYLFCFLSLPTFLNWCHADDRSAIAWPATLPVYDHIVVVVEENKDYCEIIDNPAAIYVNGVLRAEGANLTRMFGEEHNSQGNYFWMFSGSNQNIGFVDRVPNAENHPNYPFAASNLGWRLIQKGLSFKGYAESLPSIGFTGNFSPDYVYARKHAPWISFSNVPNGTTVETSSNLRFADFPTNPADYRNLPTVSFVIPNLKNDMHDDDPAISVARGDRWLRQNIDGYYQWAKSNNSLLIVTFDENNDRDRYDGLTNPFVEPGNDEYRLDLQNRIVTIFGGAKVKHGDFDEGLGVTHVNLLRTIEAMYGLPKSGAQQPNAAGGGISDDKIITDLFVPAN
jgi:acid phosphatase